MDAAHLEQLVQREIAEYRYEVHDGLIGNPLSPEKVQRYLDDLRHSLVRPRLQQIELRDTINQIDTPNPIIAECWVVADDRNGYLVCFDPDANEFMLAAQFDNGHLATINVRGDLVGVFMSR